MKKTILIGIGCIISTLTMGQSAYDLVHQETDHPTLQGISDRFHTLWKRDMRMAERGRIEMVQQNGDEELIFYGFDGPNPVYLQTFGRVQGNTVHANHIGLNGHKSLNLSGSTLNSVNIWDSGHILDDHAEFGDRVTLFQPDEDENHHYHATVIGGIIGASGVDERAIGVAPEVNMRSADLQDDVAEMADEASAGAILSNHSYGGYPYTGLLLHRVRAVEEIIQANPYYQPFYAMGNTSGWITVNAAAKNVASVGNTKAIPHGYMQPGDLVLHPTSGYGPANENFDAELRIKPDFVAPGYTWSPSVTSGGNATYGGGTGTSYSTPVAVGAATLVQEFSSQEFGEFLHNSSLKGLLCHTANDGGHPGPDAQFGYGMVDATRAIEHLENKGCGNYDVQYVELNEGEVHNYPVTVSGNSFKATMAWTDAVLPYSYNNGDVLVIQTMALANDLDLKLISTDGTEFFPYMLDPADPEFNPAITGNNNGDNVIQIHAKDIPPGDYTLEVSHEGTLQDESQMYSLITGDFEVVVDDYQWSGPSNFIECHINCSEEIVSTVWSGPNGFSSTNLNNYDLEAGDYILTVTTVSGCVFTKYADLKCVRAQCKGDMNGDGVLNTSDLLGILAQYNTECNDGECYDCIANMQMDLMIDQLDLDMFLYYYGHTCEEFGTLFTFANYKSNRPKFSKLDLKEGEFNELSISKESGRHIFSQTDDKQKEWLLLTKDLKPIRIHYGETFKLNDADRENGNQLMLLSYYEPGDHSAELLHIDLGSDLTKVEVDIYPNPATDHLTINANEGRIAELDILDTTGKSIRTIPADGKSFKMIDVTDLPNGVYLLRTTLIDGHTSFREFVKG